MHTEPKRAAHCSESSNVVVPTSSSTLHRFAIGFPCRGGDRGALLLGKHRGRQAHRRGPASNQQGVPWLKLQRTVERAPRGLDHLGQCTEGLPIQRCVDGLHLTSGYTGVLGIAAVKLPAHAAHGGCDGLPRFELATRCLLDSPDRLDTEYAGKLDPR